MANRKPKTRRKAYADPQGIFEGNPRGFGFVKTAEGEFFIPASKTNGAFDGDLVQIARIPPKDRKQAGKKRRQGVSRSDLHDAKGSQKVEGRVVRVVERAHVSLVGRYEIAGPFGIVVPDDDRITHDIFTVRRESPDIADGSIVRVRITEYPTRRSSATGVIEEVLGDESSLGLVEDRVIAKHNLETRFSDASIEQAKDARLDVTDVLSRGYRDLRDRFIFTIDPADARDFDDAISIDRIEAKGVDIEGADTADAGSVELDRTGGAVFLDGHDIGHIGVLASKLRSKGIWRLGVHIADVSAYVEWGSSIDLDARRRATSVYLADRVIPMLPEELSNDLCSLRPCEDRLCFTCDMYVMDSAELVAYDIYPAVMRSSARLTYDEALAMLQGERKAAGENCNAEYEDAGSRASAYDDLIGRLKRASKLAKARASFRSSQGGIEFSTKEAKVSLDDDGNVAGIVVREKNDATELIEEAMVFANEVCATHLFEREWPCIYRDHEKPATDALAEVVAVLQEFPWFKREHADGVLRGNPHVIQDVLDECEGRIESEMVTMLFLRAMMRAVYSPQNMGHYGLGLKAYCHFTSPIRRYPDLVVHRMLKAQILGRPEKFDQEVNSLRWIAEHSSEMERVAEAASLDSQKARIVQYMEQFTGQTFEAVVSGVATYGLYVRLDNCAEGLVPVRSLGDEYFIFDPVRYVLRGSDTGKTYRLGQSLRVVLTEADTQSSRLTFTVISRSKDIPVRPS